MWNKIKAILAHQNAVGKGTSKKPIIKAEMEENTIKNPSVSSDLMKMFLPKQKKPKAGLL